MAEDWTAAATGNAAIGLLARVAPRRGARSVGPGVWLGELAGLGSAAAACCLQAGGAGPGRGLWEQGRGVLLGQALDYPPNLTRLTERHPDLGAEFVRLRDALAAAPDTSRRVVAHGVVAPGAVIVGPGTGVLAAGETAAVAPAVTAAVTDQEVERRQALAADFERLLGRIRKQAGFRRFLQPLPVAELRAAAQDGPVVLVNITEIRSDALLLTPEGVQVVPLALTPQAVQDQTAAFLAAPRRPGRPRRRRGRPGRGRRHADPRPGLVVGHGRRARAAARRPHRAARRGELAAAVVVPVRAAGGAAAARCGPPHPP